MSNLTSVNSSFITTPTHLKAKAQRESIKISPPLFPSRSAAPPIIAPASRTLTQTSLQPTMPAPVPGQDTRTAANPASQGLKPATISQTRPTIKPTPPAFKASYLWLLAIPVIGWVALGIIVGLRAGLLQNPTDAARNAFKQAVLKVKDMEENLNPVQILQNALVLLHQNANNGELRYRYELLHTVPFDQTMAEELQKLIQEELNNLNLPTDSPIRRQVQAQSALLSPRITAERPTFQAADLFEALLKAEFPNLAALKATVTIIKNQLAENKVTIDDSTRAQLVTIILNRGLRAPLPLGITVEQRNQELTEIIRLVDPFFKGAQIMDMIGQEKYPSFDELETEVAQELKNPEIDKLALLNKTLRDALQISAPGMSAEERQSKILKIVQLIDPRITKEQLPLALNGDINTLRLQMEISPARKTFVIRGKENTWQIPTIIEGTKGTYQLTELLGAGGQGTVLAATRHGSIEPSQLSYQGPIVVKAVPLTELNQYLVETEFSATSSLTNPNAAKILDYVIDEETGFIYLVMPRAYGDLSETQVSNPEEARQLLHDTTEVLAEMHEGGIGHFDIKPANFLRGADGKVLVADFGMAGTPDGHPRGTPRYAASEVYRTGPIFASDIFSLGVTLSYLTRQNPATTEDQTSPYYDRASGKVIPPIRTKFKVANWESVIQERFGFSQADLASPLIRKPIAAYSEDERVAFNELKQTSPQKWLNILISQMMHPIPAFRPTAILIRELTA